MNVGQVYTKLGQGDLNNWELVIILGRIFLYGDIRDVFKDDFIILHA